jgi:hypothetical protein
MVALPCAWKDARDYCHRLRITSMTRKEYLRNADLPPTPFTACDYVLSAVAFSLIAVAAVLQIASMIVRPRMVPRSMHPAVSLTLTAQLSGTLG